MNIGLMLYGMGHDFKRLVANIASDCIGPAGAIPFERLVARHLGFFHELRSRGLTWEQISRLLAGAGILHGDGRAFSPSHLRGVYGRQQKRAPSGSARPPENIATVPATRISPARPPKTETRRASTGRQAAGNSGQGAFVRPSASIDPHATGAGGANGDSEAHSQPDDGDDNRPAASPSHRDRTDILALMRQSALARSSG